MSNNNLTSLPDIALCLELEMVCLENNQIESIPDLSALKKLVSKLKILKLAGNRLANIPARKQISLCDNLLETVPPELGNLKVDPFSFSLNGNPLITVPEEVMNLNNVLDYDCPLAQPVCDGLYIGNLCSAKNSRCVQFTCASL